MITPDALRSVRERIEKARARAGRGSTPPIQLVAVTKTFPVEFIIGAYEAGVRSIGETRVQEALVKFNHLPDLPGLNRRLIGHLQTNKARKAVGIFETIDSIDSVKLGEMVSTAAQDQGKQMPVLLQVNTAGDPAKFGFDPAATDQLLGLVDLPGIKVEGLMTIGALTTQEAEIRRTFRHLWELMEDLNRQLGPDRRLGHLSMGMTGDFEIAVEEGATIVRIGTALFGPRPV